jgi:transcriptional regulator with XRE-family HTH domain
MKDINKLTGCRIQEIRKAKGKKASHMAEILGISESAYSQTENGKSQITIARLYDIAVALDISMNDLLPQSISQLQADKNAIKHIQTDPHSNQVDFLVKEILKLISATREGQPKSNV